MSSSILPISCIIVHYNTPVFLEKCIKSISLSKKKPYEVLIIDNNSELFLSKKKQLALTKLLKGVSLRIVRNKENIGFGRGVNKGVGLTSNCTSHVLLLNPDLFVNPQAIGRIWKTAINCNADIVGGQTLDLISGNPQLVVTKKINFLNILVEFTSLKKILHFMGINYDFWNKEVLRLKKATSVFSVSGGFMLIKKKTFFDLKTSLFQKS